MRRDETAGIMPWREQVRLGWKAVKWAAWPSDMIRAEEIVLMYAVSVAALIGMALTGSLVPLFGALIVAVLLGYFGRRR